MRRGLKNACASGHALLWTGCTFSHHTPWPPFEHLEWSNEWVIWTWQWFTLVVSLQMSFCIRKGLLYVILEKNKNTIGSFKRQLSSAPPPIPNWKKQASILLWVMTGCPMHAPLVRPNSIFVYLSKAMWWSVLSKLDVINGSVNHKFLSLATQGSLPVLESGSGSENMLSSLYEMQIRFVLWGTMAQVSSPGR